MEKSSAGEEFSTLDRRGTPDRRQLLPPFLAFSRPAYAGTAHAPSEGLVAATCRATTLEKRSALPADYAAFARALSEHFTVHTIERRGRGESGPQGDDYSIVKECEDVLALQAETASARSAMSIAAHCRKEDLVVQAAEAAADAGAAAGGPDHTVHKG